MAKCDYCGSTIIMGGVKAGNQRFCNSKCLQYATVLGATRNIPSDVLDQKIQEVWRGLCPKCRGMGPVDVHKVHSVWSALLLTRWSTKPQVSCRSCAIKDQMGGALFSLVCGWWGFPWGLVLTPVQITRNIMGMANPPDGKRPSESLRKLVLVRLGAQMMSRPEAGVPPRLPPQGA